MLFRSSAEVFLSNMDYAQVSAAVVTQEFIDGIQNEYLAKVSHKYPDRFFVCGMCKFRKPGYLQQAKELISSGFKAIKIPAHRLFLKEGRVMLNSDEMMRYGKEEASMEEIYNACHKAGIYDDIKKMPEGLKTVIGERGEKLSGGQRQRLILARLFLQDKEILVIDEGTSGLDQKTENIVFDSLRAIQKDKTVIVVTHKEESLV